MTRDDIIRMAREAGGNREDPSDLLTTGILERFAKLVAAHEREACARVCEEATAAWTEVEHNEACVACACSIRARGKT